MCKTRQDPVTDESMDLRSRAQAVMQEKAVDPVDVSTLPTKELQGLVHELQVHQIELELQNEERNSLHLESEASRVKYQDLYDSVPVGCGDIYLSDGSTRLLQEMKTWIPLQS